MWSGPRNISTAMMRSWESRPDTIVCDEPFYAHYLKQTGFTHHPVHEEIIADHETDWQKVVQWITDPLPTGTQIFYQKHMAHHMLPHIALDWTAEFTNVFLIRDPREMLLSLLKVLPDVEINETGLSQQVALFDRIRDQTGAEPPVIDAKDVLLNPEGVLRQLCKRIDVEFDACMLRWEAGFRETDGVWARHWYANTSKSTGFASYTPREGDLPEQYHTVWQECQQLYDSLAKFRISA